jgi:uncharacterized membrane protein
MSEDKDSREYFREGKEEIEKGTQKVIEEGIEKGREQRKRLDYYSNNRKELIQNFSQRLGDSKEPAASGLVIVVPILVTLIFVNWMFQKITQIPGNQYFNITDLYVINQTLKLSILLGLAAIIVTGIGRFGNTSHAFKLEKLVDEIFGKIPFISSIYNMSKITTETVLGGAEDLSKPVKVEYNGVRLTAFKTGNQTKDGRHIVFLPTAPNITSGLVLEMEEDQIQETDETAEHALTKILSAGFGKDHSGDEE